MPSCYMLRPLQEPDQTSEARRMAAVKTSRKSRSCGGMTAGGSAPGSTGSVPASGATAAGPAAGGGAPADTSGYVNGNDASGGFTGDASNAAGVMPGTGDPSFPLSSPLNRAPSPQISCVPLSKAGPRVSILFFSTECSSCAQACGLVSCCHTHLLCWFSGGSVTSVSGGGANGNNNGRYNVGNANGNINGNGNTGSSNGNYNGNFNVGSGNGNNNGVGNVGSSNGNGNGNENGQFTVPSPVTGTGTPVSTPAAGAAPGTPGASLSPAASPRTLLHHKS